MTTLAHPRPCRIGWFTKPSISLRPIIILKLNMKKRNLLTSLVLALWICHSFGAGLSKPLVQSDYFSITNSKSVREVVGIDCDFSGKIANAASGNLMLLLNEPVFWTTIDEDGESQSIQASIFEYNPVEDLIVEAYPVSSVKTEESEGEALLLNDLIYDPSAGIYYGLDTEKKVLYAFEYGPEQPVTVMVEKNRMVEVIIPPEPLLKELNEPEPPVIETDTEKEEPAGSVESVETTANLEEAIPEESSETSEELSEIAVEEEGIDLEEPELPVAEPTVEESTEDSEASVEESTEEGDVVVIPEAEETIDLAPSEMAEILEEVEEPIIPKTKWVEETYEEAVTVMEKHKFGSALVAYDLADLGLNAIADITFNELTGDLVLLAQDSEDHWVLSAIQVEGNHILQSGETIPLNMENNAISLFLDQTTHHWVIVTDKGAEMHGKQGRFLRLVSETATFNNVCAVSGMTETGEPTKTLYSGNSSSFGLLEWTRNEEANVHHVPSEFATIQMAIDAASDDDWILLSPGHYAENLTVVGKSLKLVSYYQMTEDLYFSDHTVVEPNGGIALTVTGDEGSSVYLAGLSFSGAETAVFSKGNITFEHCEIVGNEIGLNLAGGTAMIADSIISENTSNGIVYSDATATLLERCSISDNGGHGIAINITPYDGVLYRTVIRHNTIRANQGSGIFFHDQAITTQREFRLENNFILENATAGVEVNLEQPDPKNLIPTGPRTKNSVYLVNNTIVGSPIGVLGGGNYRMVNNIIAQSSETGIKDVLYNSAVIRNLFWENEKNAVDSNFNAANNREEDPLFVGDDYILSVRSPAKRAGIPGNLWNDTSDRSGADIGASR